LIKFDVSNTSYYVEIENGALLRAVMGNDPWRSWEIFQEKCGNPVMCTSKQNKQITNFKAKVDGSFECWTFVWCMKCLGLVVRFANCWSKVANAKVTRGVQSIPVLPVQFSLHIILDT